MERNPYDPIDVKMPTFWQATKVGAGLMFGAGLCMGVFWFPFIFFSMVFPAVIGALLHH